MTSGRSSPPPPSRPGRSEPWRHQHMVQRVPAHLGETINEPLSPGIVIAGVVLLLVVVCAVAFILLGGPARFGLSAAASTVTPTRTLRAVTPIVTGIPVTPSPPTPTLGPTPVTIKYKVKPGDSLLEIAIRYKVSVQAIKNANNLKDDTIRIGEELLIPLPTPTPLPGTNPQPPPAFTPTPISYQSPPTAATAAGTPGVIRYIVQRGDTLITIAAANGSSVDAIRTANQLESDLLSIGQVLMIPVGAWTPTVTPVPVVNATMLPTAQFAYAAPSLLSPSDGKEFHGNQDVPQLMWASPGTLKPNEFYVVHVEYVSGDDRKVLPSLTVKQGTSVTLKAADYYPGANPNGTLFRWYVVVVSQAATGPRTPSSQTYASSPPSVTRTFVWY